MRGLLHHDEELAARGVGSHGPGHGQHAPVVGQVVLKAVLCELAPDGVARSAHAGPVRTATLDHKAGDHPVEDQAVIIAPLDQADKVIHRVGRRLGIELRLDDAAVLHLNGDNGVLCHKKRSFLSRPKGRPPDDLSTGLWISSFDPSHAWRPAWPPIPVYHRAFCPSPGPAPA